jgi:hypothetical protein
LASLVNISDDQLRDIVLTGPDRRDLVFRYRTRSTALRLDQPDLRVAGGWTAGPGDTATLRIWAEQPGRWCLANAGQPVCGLGFTIGSGWSLLYYVEAFPPWARLALSAGWVAALAFPVGFMVRRRTLGGGSILLVVLGTLWVPGLVRLLPTTPVEWAGLAAGLAAGVIAARLIARPRGAPSGAGRSERGRPAP